MPTRERNRRDTYALPLTHAAACDELVHNDDDGDDQQPMQQTATGDRRRESENPKNQEDDSNCVEHDGLQLRTRREKGQARRSDVETR